MNEANPLPSHRMKASEHKCLALKQSRGAKDDVLLKILVTYEDLWNDITPAVPQDFVRSSGAKRARDCRDVGSARWLSHRLR